MRDTRALTAPILVLFAATIASSCFGEASVWAKPPTGNVALSSSHIQAPHIDVELIANQQSAAPGEHFRAGVLFKLEKGWHVYWKNPGDSGEAPVLDWLGHSDFEAGGTEWPVPQKIITGPLVNYGYEDQVLLTAPITTAKKLRQKRIDLTLNCRWLVCREACIPGKATLILPLLTSIRGEVDSAREAIFESTREMLPQVSPLAWKMTGAVQATEFSLQIAGIKTPVESVHFFPDQSGWIAAEGQISFTVDNGTLNIRLPRSDQLIDQYARALTSLPGLLVITSPQSSVGYAVSFPLSGPSEPRSSPNNRSLASVLLFALVGGLILNLMPCVFPVLSIKVMSLVKMAQHSRGKVIGLGWAYTAGVLASFWILVGILFALKIGGREIGWGFQLQSPQFILVLASVLFTFGLSLLGLFEFQGKFTGWGSALTRKDGYAGSFFTGALAVLVATPCTAPFMGSAIGYALTQPAPIAFAVFTCLAVGLASPYVLISYLPSVGRYLPRPGPWMETFKESMAFLIFATVLWLCWIIQIQAAGFGLYILVCTLFVIGFSVWLTHRFPSAWLIGIFIGAISVVLATLSISSVSSEPSSSSTVEGSLNWERYSPEKVAFYQTKGRPVFVDFTAAWCVSCKVNELMVFRSNDVITKLKEKNVALLKGDWTNQDPVITRTLSSYGRSGVPFYLIYGKEKDKPATPLPEVITAGLVLKELEKLQ